MSAQNCIELESSTTLDALSDGSLCEVKNLHFRAPRLFTSVAFTDGLVVKRPSSALLRDFNSYVRKRDVIWAGHDLVRPALPEEKDSKALLLRYREFSQASKLSDIHAHYLAVHKLQAERLSRLNGAKTPRSRFLLARESSALFFTKYSPLIVQDRVYGTSLLDMVEDHVNEIIPKYRPLLTSINKKLTALLDSPMRDDLNWFIVNFLYDERTDVLWYVDSKPSCLFASRPNDASVNGIRKIFFKY